MRALKKALITLAGFGLLAIGIVLLILPGPAVVFIPAGLALLSLEYEWAKKWLKIAQKKLSRSAMIMDRWLHRFRARGSVKRV